MLPPSLGLTLFHTGIIVEDLEASMNVLSSLDGMRWAPPRVTTTPMIGPQGHIPREVRFTYSLDGPHYVELLQQAETAPYDILTGGRRIHHLGYLAKDLAADSERLDALGFRREMYGIDDNGAISRATYHYHDLFPGMWVELVDPLVWADLSAWIEAARAEAG